MSTETLQADYLVIGAGASAMAFVDTLLSEDSEATVLMVDRHHRPGGHWNDAYSFVRLHQPAEFYGVASREMAPSRLDEVGANAGLHGLASGAEVLAHFDRAMQERFLPSGRVRWLPMTDCTGPADAGAGTVHTLRSLTTGQTRTARALRRIVDGTLAQTAVPSTHAPRYDVATGVECVPLNQLPQIRRAYGCYTVVGSGKTGMDAVLWLLDNGLEAARVRWIMPHDAWLLDRANLQPGAENAERSLSAIIAEAECIAEADSVPDLMARLEACGVLMRIDPHVTPTRYRCALVSRGELAELRRVQDIVRLGRVRCIEKARIVLDQGSVPAEHDTLYIDCSASALRTPKTTRVFDGDRIHLLMLRTCQPVFSAALIAWVESHVSDPAEKAALCSAVPLPEVPADFVAMWAATAQNSGRSRQNAALSAWLMQCRLNAIGLFVRGLPAGDPRREALLQRIGQSAAAARAHLPTLMATTSASAPGH